MYIHWKKADETERVIIQEEQKVKDRQRRNRETRKRQRLLAEEQRRAGTSHIASRYTITPREDAGIAQMLGPGWSWTKGQCK
eukprot:scaffold9393_cov139-Chaetoceros_neogracile.AAC.1